MPKNVLSDEFRCDAVALVESGIPQKTVCKDLGASKSALQAWLRDSRFQAHGMTPSTDPADLNNMLSARLAGPAHPDYNSTIGVEDPEGQEREHLILAEYLDIFHPT